MNFTQQELDNSNAVLNDFAVNLRGSELSFYVHYWGGEKKLYTNHVHKHSFFEICYVIDGEGTYEEGEDRVPLNPGTLFMSRPHLKHQIISSEGLFIIFVAFEMIPSESSTEGVRRFQNMEKFRTFHIQQAEQLPAVMIWLALLKQVKHAERFFEDSILGLSGALITAFECTFADTRSAAKLRVSQPSSSSLVHRAKLYIRDNLAQDLNLASVTKHLHVSPRHLSRLFSEELGQTFTNYVRKERIRQAVILLTTTDWSIKRVAEETGFDTVHYFTTVFKTEMGAPPGQFLKKLKEHTELF
ncbi:AraC family transcriptional regulator [Paenibacillus nasutitermitis]|uniref:HTH-type transcriptional regulator YfiF n=1 Tax=Paenibacillus nasutitermitis TaxID=1652958 RepID=A0A916ZA16_9BACL|nr:AraC family transcriptional regulator [Paenibacillus nasutitermitis]GGD83117.1 putative HTH-type transcriptional regulator YfiF [Paenibacillus nasutitermitis]